MSQPRLVAGVDCSTQATKVVVCDADTGEVLREGRAPHPDATQVDPAEWWKAWEIASEGLLDGVEAISVAGQQHGMVLLDDSGEVVHPAVLWNDTASADATVSLVSELGGPGAWADAVGSVPVPSFTVTKLRWVRGAAPDAAARAAAVVLPHDWMTHRLAADRSGISGITTDRGDASGTGWWSPASNSYRPDLVELAFGRSLELPCVAGLAEIAPVLPRSSGRPPLELRSRPAPATTWLPRWGWICSLVTSLCRWGRVVLLLRGRLLRPLMLPGWSPALPMRLAATFPWCARSMRLGFCPRPLSCSAWTSTPSTKLP